MDGLSPNFFARSIREDEVFLEAKAKLGISHPRLDDVMSGFGLSVALNPERYPVAVEGTNLRLVKTEAREGVPGFLIYYTYDEEYVHLLNIELVVEDSVF